MNGRLRANLWACGAAAALLVYLLATATGGFEHWTFESLRRARATQGQLQAADIALVDSHGRALRPWRHGGSDQGRTTTGDVRIVDFVFTRCLTVCQSLGTAFQQMQARLLEEAGQGDAARVQLLSISFDTGHDGPEALHAYAQRYRADPSRWTVAVPAGAAGNQALLRALQVVVIPDGSGGYAHNAGLHVIDSRGRLAAIYDLEAWPLALAHARALAAAAAP